MSSLPEVLRALADRIEAGDIEPTSTVGAIGFRKFDLGKLGTRILEEWQPHPTTNTLHLVLKIRRSEDAAASSGEDQEELRDSAAKPRGSGIGYYPSRT